MLQSVLTRRLFISYIVSCSLPLISSSLSAAENIKNAQNLIRRPQSYLDRKFGEVVLQTEDFTCGAASVATILTFYWNRLTTEVEVINIIRSRYTKELWTLRENIGISFDDLIFAANELGFEAVGAELPIAELSKLAAPVIIHLDKGKFQHFSVLRRAASDVYYLADSIIGQTVLTQADFLSQYTGKVLAIAKPKTKLPNEAILSTVKDGTSVSRIVGDTMLNGFEHLPPRFR